MKIPAEQSAERHYLGRSAPKNRRPAKSKSTSPQERQGDRGDNGDDDDAPRQQILEDFASEDEVAQEFGVTVQTLRRWRRRKTGPPWVRGPGGVIYHVPSSREWLRNNLVMPQRACG